MTIDWHKLLALNINNFLIYSSGSFKLSKTYFCSKILLIVH